MLKNKYLKEVLGLTDTEVKNFRAFYPLENTKKT
eukprot:UN17938